MTTNQEAVISHVLMQIEPNAVVDEDKIKGYIAVFKMLNPLTIDEEEEVIKELHSRLSVRMDRGACVKDRNHVTWYYSAKRDIQSVYWNRYRTYLMKYYCYRRF